MAKKYFQSAAAKLFVQTSLWIKMASSWPKQCGEESGKAWPDRWAPRSQRYWKSAGEKEASWRELCLWLELIKIRLFPGRSPGLFLSPHSAFLWTPLRRGDKSHNGRTQGWHLDLWNSHDAQSRLAPRKSSVSICGTSDWISLLRGKTDWSSLRMRGMSGPESCGKVRQQTCVLEFVLVTKPFWKNNRSHWH